MKRTVEFAEDHKDLHKTSEPETNFSWKIFKLIDKFEALLQTQAAEVGCSALEKTSLIRNLLSLGGMRKEINPTADTPTA